MTVSFIKNKWSNDIINRLSRPITIKRIYKHTHPLSGEEYLAISTTESADLVFFKTDQKWTFDKEGNVEGGDAFAVTSSTVSLNKNDLIEIQNDRFSVHDKLNYYGDDNNEVKLFTYYNLFKSYEYDYLTEQQKEEDTTLFTEKASYNGSDCTGDDGTLNRTLSHTANLTDSNQIIVNGLTLVEDTDYTKSGSVITFLITIYDTYKIVVYT